MKNEEKQRRHIFESTIVIVVLFFGLVFAIVPIIARFIWNVSKLIEGW